MNDLQVSASHAARITGEGLRHRTRIYCLATSCMTAASAIMSSDGIACTNALHVIGSHGRTVTTNGGMTDASNFLSRPFDVLTATTVQYIALPANAAGTTSR